MTLDGVFHIKIHCAAGRLIQIAATVFCFCVAGLGQTKEAGGLFPKMPPASTVFMAGCHNDAVEAQMSARALQGLVNQSHAEAYVLDANWERQLEQLGDSGKHYEKLDLESGSNAGLRTFFRKYGSRVKKLFLYDPAKDWTWYLALMAGAQQDGIPVTEALKKGLSFEFDWHGEVEDYRQKWTNRIEAYDWALANLMPGCNKQVLFATPFGTPLFDYAVAAKGFAFWLDFNAEHAEIQKIFRTDGYGVGTSLMGYANTGDAANEVANPFGIGYVTSDLYANGSFWPAFPNKKYTQGLGHAIEAQPGKIYASIMWSDGDNLQFDQNALYNLWHDPARGTIPVATPLAPALQELNPTLLDWYYAKSTGNDELIAGPTGFQFIFIKDFNGVRFSDWCSLNQAWCAGAGFHSARLWRCPSPSVKYSTYMKTCGFAGVLDESWSVEAGLPPRIPIYWASDEENLHQRFIEVKPNPRAPVFVNFTPIVAGIYQGGLGYTAVKRQMERVQKEYPSRYVFLLPKDQFATIQASYNAATPQIAGQPGTDEGITPVQSEDGEFTIEERNGVRCWLAAGPKPKYLYFDADDRFLVPPGTKLEIAITYLDEGTGNITLDYDSTDTRATHGGVYKHYLLPIHRLDSGQWKTARFIVSDARFGNRQNSGTDFRFNNEGTDLAVSSVQIRRMGH